VAVDVGTAGVLEAALDDGRVEPLGDGTMLVLDCANSTMGSMHSASRRNAAVPSRPSLHAVTV
jgi:hypothetical protein